MSCAWLRGPQRLLRLRLCVSWALAATGCVVLLLGVAAPAWAGWQAPVTLSRAGGDVPRVGVDARGDAIAVWDENTGLTSSGSYGFEVKAALRPAGSVWATPVTIGTASGVSGGLGGLFSPAPSMAVDPRGNAVVVWGSSTSFPVRTVWAVRKSAGGAWSNPVRLSGGAEGARDVQVALDGRGDAVVVWGSTSGIQALFGTVGGGWGKAMTVSGSRYGLDPQLAVDSRGNVLVIWAVPTSRGLVLQAASKPAGAGWKRLVNIGSARGEARVAFDSRGDAVVVFEHDAVGSYGDVLQAAFRPGGGRWRKPVTRSGAGGQMHDLHVAFDSRGEVMVVWARQSSTVGRRTSDLGIQTAGFGTARRVWRKPVTVTAAAGYLVPELAVDRYGDALVMWIEPGGVVRAASRLAGRAWQKPVTVAPGFGCASCSVSRVDAAFDAHGNAVAVWRTGFGGPIVQASSFTGGGG